MPGSFYRCVAALLSICAARILPDEKGRRWNAAASWRSIRGTGKHRGNVAGTKATRKRSAVDETQIVAITRKPQKNAAARPTSPAASSIASAGAVFRIIRALSITRILFSHAKCCLNVLSSSKASQEQYEDKFRETTKEPSAERPISLISGAAPSHRAPSGRGACGAPAHARL